MFSDYKLRVINLYLEKSRCRELPLNLLNSSPARLREECAVAAAERLSKRDEAALKVFFGSFSSPEDLYYLIKKADADKFKPLDNWMKRKSGDTDDKNVELLAWLIDFPERPYINSYMRNSPAYHAAEGLSPAERTVGHSQPQSGRPEAAGPGEDMDGQFLRYPAASGAQSPGAVFLSAKRSWSEKLPFLLAPAALIMFMLIFFAMNGDFRKKDTCMYWAGDRFVRANFDQKIPNVQLVALDTFRLNNFFKITRTDTLGPQCVGKIWYSKINKQVEFFTTGGMHPRHPDRQLKPVSLYMFKKYIQRKAE